MLRHILHFMEAIFMYAVPLAIVLLFALPVFAVAKDKNNLVGSWKLVSLITEDVKTKEKLYPYGQHPKGYLILTSTGRIMALVTGDDRKPPTTDEERSAAFRAMVAY